ASSLSFFHVAVLTLLYTLSLHDALPIFGGIEMLSDDGIDAVAGDHDAGANRLDRPARRSLAETDRHALIVLLDAHAFAIREHARSEEHTSELQSRENLVCRLLLEKKKDE